VALLKRNEDNASPQESEVVDLNAFAAVRLLDVVDALFRFSGAAALRVSVAGSHVAVNSRTYNLMEPGNQLRLPPGSTFGQFVPAFTVSEAIATGQHGRLLHLSQSPPAAGARTNLGLVNATGTPTDVEVALYSSDGRLLGKLDGTTTRLRAFEFKQIDKVFEKAGATSVVDGLAVVIPKSPLARIFTYASVVDNATGDPMLVQPIRY
jgi:hypothetical protein